MESRLTRSRVYRRSGSKQSFVGPAQKVRPSPVRMTARTSSRAQEFREHSDEFLHRLARRRCVDGRSKNDPRDAVFDPRTNTSVDISNEPIRPFAHSSFMLDFAASSFQPSASFLISAENRRRVENRLHPQGQQLGPHVGLVEAATAALRTFQRSSHPPLPGREARTNLHRRSRGTPLSEIVRTSGRLG